MSTLSCHVRGAPKYSKSVLRWATCWTKIPFTYPYLSHDDHEYTYTYMFHGGEGGGRRSIRRGVTVWTGCMAYVCTARLYYMHATSSVTPCAKWSNKESAIPSYHRRYHRHGSASVDFLPWQRQPVPARRADLAVSDRAGGPVQSLPVPLRGSSRQIRLVN